MYQPPERCYTNVNIEETPHGYRLFRDGESHHFTVIPLSKAVSVDYKGSGKNE